ncbi:MAG: hypothetical protein MK082_12270 [Phycisphaerales bacterium]|nr:hypothetical protein [Phycisphaerales bacterium]
MFILLGSLFLAFASTGCNYIVMANYALEGTGKTPAEHALEPWETLVFIDDPANILPRTVLRANLAEEISTQLVTRQLVPLTVEPTDAMAMVRSRERRGDRMSMEQIAKEADVPQLIFIEMESFSLTESEWVPRPNASCLIKVLDFEQGRRVYPQGDIGDYGGRRISVSMREISPESMRSTSGRRQAELNLVSRLARDIVKLFYEYETKDLGENLGTR